MAVALARPGPCTRPGRAVTEVVTVFGAAAALVAAVGAFVNNQAISAMKADFAVMKTDIDRLTGRVDEQGQALHSVIAALMDRR